MKLFYKGLVIGKKHKAGRNRNGRICVRRRQGGCDVLYRKVNFNLSFTSKDNYQLVRSEYDPNRSSFIGLLYNYKDQKFTYILLPEGLAINELILNSFENSFKRKPGFRSYLDYFPLGSLVHNISLSNLGHGLLCRSRGSFAKILQKNVKNKYIRIRLPSGEERLVHKFCKATLGTVANIKKSIKKKKCRLGSSYGKPSVSKRSSNESC